MAAYLNFFGGFSIDMQNPAALYGDNVLVDFTSGYFPSPDLGDGTVAPCVILNDGSDDSEIRLWGSNFEYGDGEGGPGDFLVAGDVDQVEIYSAADIAAGTETYRMVLAFDVTWPSDDVISALTTNDLSPLYAGQALYIAADDLADTLVGGTLNDTMFGYAGNDKLIGNAGSDLLSGQANNDNLSGGAGADVLSGGSGKDTLTGGTGKDEFWFISAGGTTNTDAIKDFKHGEGDKICVDNEVFLKVGLDGALKAGAFKAAANIGATSGGTGVDTSDRILYDTDSGNVYYDSNGSASGGRVLLCTVFDTGSHHPTLVAGDFKVI